MSEAIVDLAQIRLCGGSPAATDLDFILTIASTQSQESSFFFESEGYKPCNQIHYLNRPRLPIAPEAAFPN